MKRSVSTTGACLLLVSVSLSGCAWRFSRLPREGELYGSVDGILEDYPELYRLQPTVGRFMFSGIMDMPYTDELIEVWGEPEETGLSWWNFSPFTLVPPFHPITYWKWHKADKRIYATIDHPIAYGYAPHVWTISIEELEEEPVVEEEKESITTGARRRGPTEPERHRVESKPATPRPPPRAARSATGTADVSPDWSSVLK